MKGRFVTCPECGPESALDSGWCAHCHGEFPHVYAERWEMWFSWTTPYDLLLGVGILWYGKERGLSVVILGWRLFIGAIQR